MKMPVISIDVPSGCPGDEGFIPSGNHVCVHADLTLSFEFPRISFFMPQWRAFCGEIKILPIGLHEPQGIKHHYYYVDLEFCRSLYMKRNPYGHKGSFGHLFLAAGSLRYSGAALLACKAAVCSGVGLLSAFVPGALKQTLNGYCPEAIVLTSEDDQVVAGSPALDTFHAVAVGPGLGMEAMTEKFLKNLIGSCRNAMVIDADALNILSENPTWLAFLPPLTILTPHPGEFERLAGKSAEGMERWKLAREFASKWNVILVLKGFNTMVVFPGGRIFFNASGNSGMAKGGSGDVLTGLIGGLLAQGYRAEDAAILGVYIHGLAGDIAEEQLGQHAMSASDLIHFFSEAFARVSA
jgi:NAD(P)H-hydrate epimerase